MMAKLKRCCGVWFTPVIQLLTAVLLLDYNYSSTSDDLQWERPWSRPNSGCNYNNYNSNSQTGGATNPLSLPYHANIKLAHTSDHYHYTHKDCSAAVDPKKQGTKEIITTVWYSLWIRHSNSKQEERTIFLRQDVWQYAFDRACFYLFLNHTLRQSYVCIGLLFSVISFITHFTIRVALKVLVMNIWL